VYRIHPEPEPGDVREFVDTLQTLGIPYRIEGEVESSDYRNILSIVANFEFKDFVEKVALRSMTKAVYSTEDEGHFGLAFDHYTHFTSPIRRYPDLLVHRLLKQYQRHGRPKKPDQLEQEISQICDQSTEREVKAVEAEREYTKLISMKFLSRRIGNTYDGIISGVASFGLFVELKDFMIEGLVHVSTMGDERFELDEDGHALVGKKSGTAHRLGDRVRVTIENVSLEELKAVFHLA
jgi:ribonuclease R